MTGFADRHVLVAGGTGLIGRPLVDLLLAEGARVRVVSLDDPALAPPGVEFKRLDLTDPNNCRVACAGIDDVFMLLCVKGSPAVATSRPAAMLVPNVLFCFHLLEAARQAGVQRYLHTSSLAVYAPAEVFHEDDVWSTFPSPHDRFAGWAKRMGELQVEAYRAEYGWDAISIVRPANTYGPFDDFTSESAMVVPSLIRRAVEGENPLVVWGDGSAVRDFIHARDVARGMMHVLRETIPGPINLGSGTGHSVRELAEVVKRHQGESLGLVFDSSKPTGDPRRILDTTRARSYGIVPQIGLAEGIAETMDWYRTYRGVDKSRYSYFRSHPAARR